MSRVSKKLKIGLTYDMRDDYLKEGYGLEETAEFDLPETIEAIERVILDNGFQADRIGNIKALSRRLVAGDRWDLVFNIAEGMYGFGREAQVPALLEAYNIPYTFPILWATPSRCIRALPNRFSVMPAFPLPLLSWSTQPLTSTQSPFPFRFLPNRWRKERERASQPYPKSPAEKTCVPSA